MEHGVFNLETVADIVQVTRLAGLTALVRVPDIQYHVIAPVLDAGAEGIMIPRVECREEVERAVACVRYPPHGLRGCSVAKGHNDYRPDELHAFARHANQQNLVIVQIERQSAVSRIQEIVSVSGVDAVLIGPNDLALSLGLPMDFSHPELQQAIQHVVDACRQQGMACGIHTARIDVLLDWHRQGMLILTYSNDLDMLVQASQQGMAALRAGIDGLKRSTTGDD
jgi:2-dehydro-3-deoxyglucarate aldolase/4-hydroxy-2-oxoheptanedioate aldolase